MKTGIWIGSLLVIALLAYGAGRINSGAEKLATAPDASGDPEPVRPDQPPLDDLPRPDFEVKVIRVEATKRFLVKGHLGSGQLGVDADSVLVYLEYRNTSEGKRYLNNGWPSGQLSDEFANRYRMLSDNHLLRPDRMPPILRAGESIRDVMVFEAPVAEARMLRLYVQDCYSADQETPRGPVELSIPVDTIQDPEKVIR